MSKLGEIQNIFPSFPNTASKNLSNIEKLGGIEYEKSRFMDDFSNSCLKY